MVERAFWPYDPKRVARVRTKMLLPFFPVP
jgi:hypothetical protein